MQGCPKPPIKNVWVWASSFSLATTQEILDLVSFPLATKLFQFASLPSNNLWPIARFLVIDNPDCSELSFLIGKSPTDSAFWQLIEAYRSLTRPSSAQRPKTSTVHIKYLKWLNEDANMTFYSIFKVQYGYQITLEGIWWTQGESNSWPPLCKSGALPTKLWAQE